MECTGVRICCCVRSRDGRESRATNTSVACNFQGRGPTWTNPYYRIDFQLMSASTISYTETADRHARVGIQKTIFICELLWDIFANCTWKNAVGSKFEAHKPNLIGNSLWIPHHHSCIYMPANKKLLRVFRVSLILLLVAQGQVFFVINSGYYTVQVLKRFFFCGVSFCTPDTRKGWLLLPLEFPIEIGVVAVWVMGVVHKTWHLQPPTANYYSVGSAWFAGCVISAGSVWSISAISVWSTWPESGWSVCRDGVWTICRLCMICRITAWSAESVKSGYPTLVYSTFRWQGVHMYVVGISHVCPWVGTWSVWYVHKKYMWSAGSAWYIDTKYVWSAGSVWFTRAESV